MYGVKAISNMVVVDEVLIIAVLVDVEIVVVGDMAIVLEFALSSSYSVDVPPGVTADLFMEALAGVILGVLTGIDIDVLADVNVNALTVVMTALEFPVSTALEKFSRCAAFDCLPLALLNCGRNLQTCMPSYHV